MKTLIESYKRKKAEIKARLAEFKKAGKRADEDVFAELAFCIFTPQSKAVYCDKAVKELKKDGLLLKGGRRAVRKRLKGVRFPNNKASFLCDARSALAAGNGVDIKSRIDANDIFKTRDWLVKNIKGLGYKEASHFLRNIGLGRNLAILDVHILKNLVKFKIVKKRPNGISKKEYLALENKLKKFSKNINIPMDELDLLFWSNETGIILK